MQLKTVFTLSLHRYNLKQKCGTHKFELDHYPSEEEVTEKVKETAGDFHMQFACTAHVEKHWKVDYNAADPIAEAPVLKSEEPTDPTPIDNFNYLAGVDPYRKEGSSLEDVTVQKVKTEDGEEADEKPKRTRKK